MLSHSIPVLSLVGFECRLLSQRGVSCELRCAELDATHSGMHEFEAESHDVPRISDVIGGLEVDELGDVGATPGVLHAEGLRRGFKEKGNGIIQFVNKLHFAFLESIAIALVAKRRA